MRIGKKLFPYPVLNNSKNCSSYKSSVFSLNYEKDIDNKFLILNNVCINTDDESLIELINSGDATAKLIVDCSQTIFRATFDINLVPQTIKLQIDDLDGKFCISCFVCANNEINKFYSDDFLDDYDGYEFNIKKHYLLAVDDGFNEKIEFEDNKDKKISSIFEVIDNSDAVDDVITYIPTNKKIEILLPEKSDKIYHGLYEDSRLQNIFFGLLAIPALTYCLQDLKDQVFYGEYDIDNIRQNFSWFESVLLGFKKIYGYDLTDDEFKKIDIPVFAQKLLDEGGTKAIETLDNIVLKQMIGGIADE